MTKFFGDDETYLNYFYQKNPITFFGFSNLDTMLDFVERVPVNDQTDVWENSSGRYEFTLTDSMNHALDLARHGWPEGVERAQEILQKINTDHAIAHKRSYSVAGGQVNVGRMLSGNPKHMHLKTKKPAKRVVTLFVEITMLAIIKAENGLLRAIITAGICDLMESKGYACEIVAVTTFITNDDFYFQSATIIKKSNERLNLTNVAFSVGHPSFLRRLTFALCASTELCKPIWKTMGTSGDIFNEKYPTGPNEFLIARLTHKGQQQLDACRDENEKIKTMIQLITPADLPIEFSE